MYIHHNQTKCSALLNIPLPSQSLEMLVSLLEKFNVCPGHLDHHFIEMGLSKNGKFLSMDRKNGLMTIVKYSSTVMAKKPL